jgi:hypothetical protein
MLGRNIQKTVSLILAGFICYLGYRLFLAGVGETASLVLEHDSLKAQLLNATPGLFFMIGGVALAIITVLAKERKQSRTQQRTTEKGDQVNVEELIVEGSEKTSRKGSEIDQRAKANE